MRTIVINNTFSARIKKTDIIDASRINAPALIVGFSSTGKATWEDSENSGIGSNGLTSGRHDLLSPNYKVHTETFSPEVPDELVYCGKYGLEDLLPGDDRFTISSALLSPTRTYAPMLVDLFGVVGRENILGLIHCSGGGQTKIGKFGQPGIAYIKDELFPTPPLFNFLQEAQRAPWNDMYKTYNMGHRMEAIVTTKSMAQDCIAVSKSYGIDAKIIGRVVENKQNTTGRTVLIQSPHGEFRYEFT